jgi:tRNA C32,U32 (ribose-2'-O)-methylase TrmJ
MSYQFSRKKKRKKIFEKYKSIILKNELFQNKKKNRKLLKMKQLFLKYFKTKKTLNFFIKIIKN